MFETYYCNISNFELISMLIIHCTLPSMESIALWAFASRDEERFKFFKFALAVLILYLEWNLHDGHMKERASLLRLCLSPQNEAWLLRWGNCDPNVGNCLPFYTA